MDKNTRSPGPSLRLALSWHALVVAVLLLLPRLKFPVPFWHMGSQELRPLLILIGAYAICALISLVAQAFDRPLGLVRAITVLLAIFGLVFIFLFIRKIDSSRTIALYSLVTALVAIPLSQWIGRFPAVAVSLLALAAAALLALNLRPSPDLQRKGVPRTDTAVIATGLYNLHATFHHDFIPAPAVSGGGLSRLGDGLLLATGDGYLYRLDWSTDGMKAQALPYRVPVNGDDFAADTTGRPWHQPLMGEPALHGKEDAGDQVITWWFRVTGVLVQELGDRTRVFVAHYYWKRAERCWVERVSLLEGSPEALLKTDGLAWRTVFDTTPCLPLAGAGRRRGTAFAGHFGGGRMVLRDANTLLLSVGDFGFNGVASTQLFSQDPAASYGKILQIDVNSGAAEIYTLGMRNPQGLYKEPGGTLWETEHGPQGGDELNRIKRGANYGWPIVTYGVDYGTFAWPLNPKQGEHEGFEAPFYAWLPSIGVSDLVGVEENLFPNWRGDLLVTSLVGQKVFRLRIRNDRVAYAEPIRINDRRIRDIRETRDGSIVLWEDDDNTIVTLRPVIGSSGEALFAANCSGCHKVGDGTSHRIGPDLWGVVERQVAASGFIGYSPALRAHGGKWTEERLSQFIENPQAVVPGSAMEIAGVPDADSRKKIIEYLRHAEKIVLN